jgi:uncharacterized protein
LCHFANGVFSATLQQFFFHSTFKPFIEIFQLSASKIVYCSMQKILITGGTGMVGRALTAFLTGKGYEVIVLTRQKNQTSSNPKVRFAHWDVAAQTIDLAALQSADYIIHLAGAGVVDKPWTAAYKKEILDSRTQSSQLILDAVKDNKHNVKALISASAIGWYGADTEESKTNGGFVEIDAADVNNFLGNTCLQWEQSVEPAMALGIRLVKLRIGIVLSNEGGALAEFKKPIKLGVAGILGDGQQTVSWIHIADLCALFLYAIEQEKLQGVFNAVAPVPCTNKALTLCLANAMKGKFFIPMHVPKFVLKWMMGERSVEVLKSTTVNARKILEIGFQFQHDSIENAIDSFTSKQLSA